MSAKKPIVVRIAEENNSKHPTSKQDHYGSEKVEKAARGQVAAAEESSDERMHTFAREYDRSLMLPKSSTSKKQSNFHMFKPILIAIISALTIGSIMGFVMLKIIVNFDNDINANPAILIPAEDQDSKEEGEKSVSTTKGESSLYPIEPLSAYVLQGGVFSEKSNAEVEAVKFDDAGFPPVIWEKDHQFYLLVGIANSKETVQHFGESLMSNGLEVYAKEWQVLDTEIELTKEEYDWIVSFQDQWKISIESSASNQHISSWQELLDQAPSQSNEFNDFISILNNLHVEMKEANDSKFQHILLSMWNAYDSFVSRELMQLE